MVQRPLRRVEKMNGMETPDLNTEFLSRPDPVTVLLGMDNEEARRMYPLESFTLGGIEDGCNVVDWAYPWASAKAYKKLTRFASRTDFVPSVQYRSDFENLADLNASPGANVKMGDRHAEHRKSTLHAVNMPDEARHGGLTTLTPLKYNPVVGEEIMTLLPGTYKPNTGEEATTLLPLTYDASTREQTAPLPPFMYSAATDDELKSVPSIKGKPVSRDLENVSSRSSAPNARSQDKIHVLDGDGDGNFCAKSCVTVIPSEATRSIWYPSLHEFDAEQSQIFVEKRHTRNGPTELRNGSSRPVDKSVASPSNAEKQATAHTIIRRPLPADTGALEQDFQITAPEQNSAL
ncbi:hypothetical protein ACET3X_005691 [Alternaria dauci]|uniref:Uncharacterized protein n=1 Tax=Alternaria dauci TaxID=48095 RepID=A0ABR3UGX5_9PLEO